MSTTELGDKRRLAAAKRWAKKNGITVEEQLLRMANPQPGPPRVRGPRSQQPVPPGSSAPDATGVLAQMQTDATAPEKQGAIRALVLHAAVRDAPAAYAKLRDLAFGNGGFAGAPAVVRRAALVDILSMAGVSVEAGKGAQSDKPLNEWTKSELDGLLGAIVQRITLATRRADAVTVENGSDILAVDSTASAPVQRTADPAVEPVASSSPPPPADRAPME